MQVYCRSCQGNSTGAKPRCLLVLTPPRCAPRPGMWALVRRGAPAPTYPVEERSEEESAQADTWAWHLLSCPGSCGNTLAFVATLVYIPIYNQGHLKSAGMSSFGLRSFVALRMTTFI